MNEELRFPIGFYISDTFSFTGKGKNDIFYSDDLLKMMKKFKYAGYPKCNNLVCKCILCKIENSGKRVIFEDDVAEIFEEESKNYLGANHGRLKHLIDFVSSGKLNNAILLERLIDE